MNALCLVSCLMRESKLFKMFTSLLEKYSWVLLSLHLVWFKATLLLRREQTYCISPLVEKEIWLLLIKIWLSGTFWLVVYHSQCLQLCEKGQQYGLLDRHWRLDAHLSASGEELYRRLMQGVLKEEQHIEYERGTGCLNYLISIFVRIFSIWIFSPCRASPIFSFLELVQYKKWYWIWLKVDLVI